MFFMYTRNNRHDFFADFRTSGAKSGLQEEAHSTLVCVQVVSSVEHIHAVDQRCLRGDQRANTSLLLALRLQRIRHHASPRQPRVTAGNDSVLAIRRLDAS